MDPKVAQRLLYNIQGGGGFAEPGPVPVGLYEVSESDSEVQTLEWGIGESKSGAPSGESVATESGEFPPPIPAPPTTAVARPPPTVAGPQESSFQARKRILQNRVNVANEDVTDELTTSRNDVIVVSGMAVLAIGAAAGAGILSNTAGFITTIVAGGGGTVGLTATLKGSLLSYGDLKNIARRKLRHANELVQDAQNDRDLDQAQAALTELANWLDSQTKPSQVVSQSSSGT